MDRRKFIAIVPAAAATALLPGCYGPAPYAGPPPPYEYYYYPHVDVYFSLYDGWYYYWSDSVWLRVRTLPPHIHLDPSYRRTIILPDHPPYREHPKHRRDYPPPATWRPVPKRDRDERTHNDRIHQQYLKRWKTK